MRSRLLTSITVLVWLSSASAAQQPAPQDVARLQAQLKEAEDLQETQLQAALEKAAPVLDELRRLQARGALTPETSGIFQSALVLQVRAQVKLLAPESDVTGPIRELLVLSPKIDDSIFNPREKLLIDKVRSAETGRLSLESDPPGSKITYLGIELGTTPVDVPLMAGTYHLRMQKTGCLDQDFDVVIRPAEILSMKRTMLRRAVEVPLSVAAADATIVLGGKTVGTSKPFEAWISSLPAERQKEYEAIIRAWNVDTASATFFLLSEVPVGQPLELELRASCYEPVSIKLQLSDQEVDWDHPRVLRPELRQISLKKDTGYLEVNSTPAGGEVWLDGTKQGKTPMGGDVCVGTHRVQVLHPAGQYVNEVVIRRGQVSKVGGEVKPALAFLGVYSQAEPDGAASPLVPEWDAVSRKLVLESTAFSDPQLTAQDIRELHRKGNLPVEKLAQGGNSAEAHLREMAAAAGRADLLLFALRTGGQYVFRLYSTLHPLPDVITLPNLENASVDFLISQLNRAEKVSARLQAPDLGIEMLDSPGGLVVVKPGGQPASNAALKPGAIVRSVDQKPMTYREIRQYLGTRKPGQSVTLEVAVSKTATGMVPVPVSFVGAEYPWSMPDAAFNCVLTMLHYLFERDPSSEEARYAGLSLARGFMERKEWKLALQSLEKCNFEGRSIAVGAGTALFYQGRCYEELGDRAQAEACYGRAKGYPDASLGAPGGPRVSVLAERRIQSLKKPIR